MLLNSDEHNKFTLARFESMLKTNNVLFFDSEEFEEIAHYYLRRGRMALAKKATKLGLEQHPSSTTLKLLQIEIYLFEDKLDQAENLLDALFMLEQSNEHVYIQKANIFSRRYKHKEAINSLEKALKVTDDPVNLLSHIGMEYLLLEDYERAKIYFMRCVELEEEEEEEGENYSMIDNVVYCFEYLEQYDEAIDYLNDFLNRDPFCAIAWLQIGKLYYQQKKYQKALAAYDFAIISNDRFIGAYLGKGRVLEKMKLYKEAIENYTITLSLNEPTSYAQLGIGKCYEKLGNPELPIKFYLKCTKEDPYFDKGWLALIDFYSKNKQFEKALYYIDNAMDFLSENVRFWKRYAKIHNRLKNYEEAEVGYRKILELGNYELESWLMRGDILSNLGELETALDNFNQALEFYPENPEIEYWLSGLYFSLRESEKGEFHLKNALNSEPEFLIIIEEVFPLVYQMKKVKQIIAQHKNTSP